MNRLLNKFEGDRSLWIIVLLMMMGSIVTTFSFVSILIKVEEGTLSGYMFKHIIFVALAIYGMYWIHKKDPQFVAKYTSLAFLLSIALLIYTALFGMKVNDAGRWVKIPVINLTFQTSDFAKLAIILFLSRQLVIFKDRLDEWKIVFWKLLIPIMLVVGLIFRDNFSTSALVFMICMVILFIGQVPFTKLLTIAGVLIGALALVIVIQLNFPEIKILPRLTTWVNRVTNRYTEPENTII